MNTQAATLLLELGLSPQDYTALADEYDLLAVADGLLHDPETAAEEPAHLEAIFKGPVAWLPGAVPYGDLWKEMRVGASAQKLRLCQSCFPPRSVQDG